MDLANRTGGLVVGTGDLSELALGWATYNGDHMSMYGVNAGVPKTLVRHLVRYEADIAASAALRRRAAGHSRHAGLPGAAPRQGNGEIAQKTEDLVGPYELHDFYLYYVLRFGFGPAKIFRLAKAAFAGRAEYPDESAATRGCATSTGGSLPSSSSAAACPTAPRWAASPSRPAATGGCPATPAAALWLAELEQIPLNDNIG